MIICLHNFIFWETLTTYFKSAASSLARFSLAQVAHKIVDTGLEVVDEVITLTGGSEKNIFTNGIKKIHTTAKTLRIEGNKKAATEKAKKIEKSHLLKMLGLKVTKTETVYED